ncbi:hypothetical protein [Pseudomonas baetica]|uniref:hypothetical protein n=1 Tax=Pseudomonas baetica TaxID=674054 RepID=UPI002405C19C|nr:hypothetical protein [Pseudomonas baetica]MDF9773276.1 hypothetical protein [Pseudomonas baetica]
MNIVSSLALVVTVGCISGCATTAESPIFNVPLHATQHNVGHIAQATLAPMGSDTDISLFIGGVPGWTALPLHVYTYIYPGKCESLGPKPAYEMNQTVTTTRMSSRTWHLSKNAPVALSELRSGDYAIVLRASPADGGFNLFCGNIA